MCALSRVGIITFHRAENFGAFLQVLALQYIIDSLGEDIRAEIIDYQPDVILNDYKLRLCGWFNKQYSFRTNCIRGIEYFYQLGSLILRKIKFHQCLSLLRLSVPSQVNSEQYDVIVLGCDQIWNVKITDGIIPFYFGDFCNIHAKKVISYAASMGNKMYNVGQEQIISTLLSKINAISIREQSHKEYIQKLSGQSVSIVLDPTLLVDRSFWDNFLVLPNFSNYVLCYSLETNNHLIEMAQHTAKVRKLKLILISPAPLIKSRSDLTIYYKWGIGPKEFVGLIKNANCIFTNSFHGTCFSIIWGKEFYSFSHSTTGSRVQDLLVSLKLESLLNPISIPQSSPQINDLYYHAFSEIVRLRSESLSFLRENLIN